MVMVSAWGCGPAPRPEWTAAVRRAADDEEGRSHRLWVVDSDGAERRVADAPHGFTPRHQQFVGWSLDGDGFYVNDGGTWIVDGGHFEQLPCDEVEYGCLLDEDEPIILPQGRLVVPHELSAAYLPGSAPLPRAWMLAIDREAGTVDVLGQTQVFGCESAGANGVILATEVVYTSDYPESLDTTRRLVMFRDGARIVLEELFEGRCPVLSPQGDRIAWPGDDASSPSVITDLERAPRHTIPPAVIASWSPDGAHLAGLGDQGLWMLDVADGTVDERARPVPVEPHQRLQWSDDGRRLVLVSPCEAEEDVDQAWVYDADGLVERHHQPCGPERIVGITPDGRQLGLQGYGDDQSFRIVTIGDGRSSGDPIEGYLLAFRPER